MSFAPHFSSLEEAFIHYTECQLATLEMYEMTKRASASRTSRQRDIAWGMAVECKRRGIQVPDRKPCRAPRLKKMLSEITV